MLKMRTAAVAFALLSWVGAAQSATRTWTGATNNLSISDPGNWSGGVAPAQGDTLLFPEAGKDAVINVDVPISFEAVVSTSHHSILFQSGTITLTGAIPVSQQGTGELDFSLAVVLASPNSRVEVFNNGFLKFESGPLTIGGPVEFHIEPVPGTFEVGQIAAGDYILESAPSPVALTGSGTITFSGAGLSGGVTSTVSTSLIGAGMMGPGSDITVAGGTVLTTFGGPTLERSMHFLPPTGSATTTSWTLEPTVVKGAVVADSDLYIWLPYAATVQGPISGSGSIDLDGPGSLVLANPGNSFAGDVRIDALASNGASEVIPDNSSVELHGTYDLGQYTETVRDFHCAGTLKLRLPGGLLHARGALTRLAPCHLDVSGSALVPTPRVAVTIIRNDSGQPMEPFESLPEGAMVRVNGVDMAISYRGGSGGDVTLTYGGPTLPSGPANFQAMWWNPSENGWGMSLVQHNETLFGAFYIYDAGGRPTWFVMPGGTWDATKTVFTGSFYQPSGSPFFAYNVAALYVGNSIGSATITFQDANNAIVDYTIGTATGRKFVTREMFASGSLASPDRSDLWWGGSTQNGWGITVMQQANTLFAVWYTYDGGGPTWFVMPGGSWTAADTYEGTLYTTMGSPWVGKTYDPSKLQVMNAGTYKFRFNGDAATFTYSADGFSGSIPLAREPF